MARRVQGVRTADDADMLANTPLQNFQPGTTAVIYIASSANDTTLTVTPPEGEASAITQRIAQRTNGMPVLSDDPGFEVDMSNGGHLTLALDIVAAATVGFVVDEV